MGAWIETSESEKIRICQCVAPYVGAWIETFVNAVEDVYFQVAPYVGAWIETLKILYILNVA